VESRLLGGNGGESTRGRDRHMIKGTGKRTEKGFNVAEVRRARNNKINTENSDTSHRRMLDDPREREEYHRQYREARKTWSIIPYNEIINRIKELSTRMQIGDFGCGEAKIVEVIGKERVYGFDHVAINDNITACDMKSVPLPNDSLDVAVFSLSLMGKNWPDYISEAKRCLATNGYLLIAETTKSLSASGRLSRLRDVIKENGFEYIR